MDKKIERIKKWYCNQCSPEGDCNKSGERCKDRDTEVKAILDLIASEQKPMVEALKEARKDLYDCLTVIALYAGATFKEAKDDLKEHPYLAKIDAVLPKGEGK